MRWNSALQENEENRRKKAAGEVFYGPCSFTRPMYLQYELTRFRLEFVSSFQDSTGFWILP